MKNVFTNVNLHLKKMGSRTNSLLTFMLLALLTTSVTALANAGSKVTISSWDNKPFILEIDHERYRTNGTITLTNLKEGRSRIRLIREKRNSHSNMNSNGGMVSVLYNGQIDIPRNSRIRAEVSRNRTLRILDVRRNYTSQRHRKPNRPAYNTGTQCGASTYEIIEENNHNGQNYGFEPYSYESAGSYGGACAMSYHEFNQLLFSIEDACFSNDQIRVIRQALRHNLISTNQLIQLLEHTAFDSTRLEIAKTAFHSLIDKEHIWKIYDAFSFSSTAREFERFVCAQ